MACKIGYHGRRPLKPGEGAGAEGAGIAIASPLGEARAPGSPGSPRLAPSDPKRALVAIIMMLAVAALGLVRIDHTPSRPRPRPRPPACDVTYPACRAFCGTIATFWIRNFFLSSRMIRSSIRVRWAVLAAAPTSSVMITAAATAGSLAATPTMPRASP